MVPLTYALFLPWLPQPIPCVAGKLATEEVEYLVEAKQSSDPGNMGPLFEWLPQQIWPRVKAIEGLKKYTGRQSTAAAVYLSASVAVMHENLICRKVSYACHCHYHYSCSALPGTLTSSLTDL
jgi:hypothetical protein